MQKNSLSIYEEGKCALFALGRNAMYAACQILKLSPGDEVLTPAFDCDGSLQPFRALGLKVRFFRSDPYSFIADIDDIKNKLTPRTKLIHVINHFGMPQPWDILSLLRKNTDMPILEDNAYSLFSKIDGKSFGVFGDISIFSLRKNLPLIDGGLLRINNPRYPFSFKEREIPLFYLRDTSSMLTLIKDRLGFYKAPHPIKQILRIFFPDTMPPPPLYSKASKGYPDWPSRDLIGKEFSCDFLRPMSRLSKIGLSKFSKDDYTEIIDKKRYYYKWLLDRLRDAKGIRILWPDLPEGIAPFCLSLLVNSNKRDVIFETLRKKYYVMAWPILSKEIIEQLDNFPEVQLINEDIRKISVKKLHKDIGDIDLIVASPECTSHSCAKGGRERCEESKLTAFEVTRFAREFRPEWIIIENVIQMKSWSGHSELLEEL